MKMNIVKDIASLSIKEKNDNRSFESESEFEPESDLGEGKVLIEPKIPKEHGGKEVEDTQYPNIDQGLLHTDSDKHSACNLCNRTFRSGKALGGHMRIHGKKTNLIFKNNLKSHQSVKFKNQNPRAAEEDRSRVTNSVKKNHTADDGTAGEADIDERSSCLVCGKVFPSQKSVCGHMRKHSDRSWRGSRPPSREKASSGSCSSCEETPENGDRDELLSDTGKECGGVDLTVFLRGWNTRARRGRKRLSSEMDAFKLKDREAAASLMMLGEDFASELEHKQETCDLEDLVNACEASRNDDIKNQGKILIKNKKQRKRVKLSDLQQPQNASPVTPEKPVAAAATSPFSKQYRGGTFEKSFQTRQAFGAHMSGHNKCTVVIKNAILKSEKPSNPTQQIEETKGNGSDMVERTHDQSTVFSNSWSSLDIDLNELPASSGSEAETGLISHGSWQA